MAEVQADCQVMAAVAEESMPTSPLVSVPEEESLAELHAKLEQTQLEIGPELMSELGRQDSTETTESLNEEDEDPVSESEVRGQRSVSVVSDASEEGGRDSGIEAERDPDMVIPDQDLIDRIVTQVEIYFGDSSVLKDKFLLKHIRRNKEGYVSLKLVSSFKKVRQLTKDWRVVAYALGKSSTGIQINDLGTKIRRTAALPEINDTPVTCTILALNLPLEKPGIDTVSQLFGECGDIALIRVLRAGSQLSVDVKPLVSKYPALNDTNCAWIEFEAPEAAKEAYKLSSDEGMKVIPIVPESPKKLEKQISQKSQPNSRKNSYANNVYQKGPNNSRKNSLQKQNSYHQQKGAESENKLHAPQRRKAISLPYNQRPNIRELNVIAEVGGGGVGGRRRPKSKSLVEFPGQGSSTSSQSWMQRHLLAAAMASAASTKSTTPTLTPQRSRVSLGSLNTPDGVLRFPKGPDGSRGFGTARFCEMTNEKTI